MDIFADSSLVHAQKFIQEATQAFQNNIGEFGRVRYWQIQFNSPNLPKFSSTRILRYTVNHTKIFKLKQTMVLQGQLKIQLSLKRKESQPV